MRSCHVFHQQNEWPEKPASRSLPIWLPLHITNAKKKTRASSVFSGENATKWLKWKRKQEGMQEQRRLWKMGTANPFRDQYSISLTKRLLPWTLCALLPIALLHLYFYPLLPFAPSPKTELSHSSSITIISHSSESSLSASPPSPSPSSAGTYMHTFILLKLYTISV